MSARDQQRGDGQASHGTSLARLLVLLGGLALVACTGDEDLTGEPVDPNDLDGDGIVNAEDLCPLSAHVSQHDEDGDGVGDACDVCPGVFDPLQRDTTELEALSFEDGVGDACDPRPSFVGDDLVAFHSFETDRDLARFRGEGWTLAGDAAHATGDATWESQAAHVGDGIYAQLRVTALAWQDGPGQVEVAVDTDTATATPGYTCAVVRDTDGDGADELVATLHGLQTVEKSLGAGLTADFTITAWRTIDRDRLGAFYCRVRVGDAQRQTEIIVPTDDSAGGRYRIATGAAAVTAGSLAVYTFPINPCAFAGRCDP